MILIADSGSTKIEWCVVEGSRIEKQFETAGANPYMQTADELSAEWEVSLFPLIERYRIRAVYYYGAGCAFPEKRQLIASILGPRLQAEIEVFSDLMGAARALCGRLPGIACILGTGANSCRYDGVEIIERTPTLGFILGDEGSGAYLGKRLVSDCLKKQLPHTITEKFLHTYQLTEETVLERVYRQPFPNRYLASLSRFLLDHIEEEAIHALVLDSFTLFLERNVRAYAGATDYPIHFLGSIAYYYQSVLREATHAAGLHPGIITLSPLAGLVGYHGNG
ncbi:N-acetylglucosamine kinase-like BadF-type ATPase [Parabacteroides sp. PFB2-12]|uniref:ATPase n=1 Tax=unclassified Parabacteroides TaxID=2649774 RepID=UPI0024769E62|nr:MULTISPECIES: ATPase [unclassified Parabacteroides]MDH6342273.1 N-acetylglucosamine kinase-like BadF-type ATPase [Parabacteroides sp. PM6-13]MDH6390616.1 N-acetylglucosamine kinase-like BadF-type ATPase [Parabacteroides sp. PFB2-12]